MRHGAHHRQRAGNLGVPKVIPRVPLHHTFAVVGVRKSIGTNARIGLDFQQVLQATPNKVAALRPEQDDVNPIVTSVGRLMIRSWLNACLPRTELPVSTELPV